MGLLKSLDYNVQLSNLDCLADNVVKNAIFGDFSVFKLSKLERCAKKSMIPLVYNRVSTCSRNYTL